MSLEKEFGYKKLVGIGEDGMFYIKSEDPDILEKTPLGKLVGERIIKFLVDQVSDFKDKKVIDIGSGSGGISLAFAKRTKHVTATDISKVGLKFVEKRAKLDNIKNISFKEINLGERLPFEDNSFDIAILKGVLEWVPETEKKGDPEQMQLNALKEIKRILKPRGILFFAIENRYYIRYLFGLKEVHCGLYFASYLPRKMANVYSWIFKRKPFRTYTYSYRGLRKLLAKAGFFSWDFYTGVPSYQTPEYIYKLDNKKDLERAIDLYYTSNTKKILAKFILNVPYFGPYILFPNNFIVVVRK